MKYSIIIPIFNEAESIPHLLDRLRPVCEQFDDYEIICIDDGSSDKSLEILLEQKRRVHQLKIIKFKHNAGKSDALVAGFKKAEGDFIITMDADLQNPPEDIPLLIDAVENYDAAIGWRHQRHDSFSKKMASKIANSIRRFFLDDDSLDTACSLKIFKKNVTGKFTMYQGMHRFFPAFLKMYNFSYTQVKVSHEPRKWGHSKYKTFGRAIPAFLDLLAVMWMRKRKLKYEIEKIF